MLNGNIPKVELFFTGTTEDGKVVGGGLRSSRNPDGGIDTYISNRDGTFLVENVLVSIAGEIWLLSSLEQAIFNYKQLEQA